MTKAYNALIIGELSFMAENYMQTGLTRLFIEQAEHNGG